MLVSAAWTSWPGGCSAWNACWLMKKGETGSSRGHHPLWQPAAAHEKSNMDINQILRHLPHRYPFLLIDRVTEFHAGEFLTGIKNVTYNEPFFQGHFPQRPVMPGVLILEAMAQATGLLAFRTVNRGAERDSLYFLVGMDRARFKRPVEPGDQLVLNARLIRSRRGIWVFDCDARVDGKVVASAEIMCTERDIDS
jgi:3-hydroxyacyl-[acyl-carrier-protein] dehydratase